MLGKQDNFLSDKDVSLLESNLRDSKVNFSIKMLDRCGHMTFMWAKDPSGFFKDILGYLEKERLNPQAYSFAEKEEQEESVQPKFKMALSFDDEEEEEEKVDEVENDFDDNPNISQLILDEPEPVSQTKVEELLEASRIQEEEERVWEEADLLGESRLPGE